MVKCDSCVVYEDEGLAVVRFLSDTEEVVAHLDASDAYEEGAEYDLDFAELGDAIVARRALEATADEGEEAVASEEAVTSPDAPKAKARAKSRGKK